MKVFNEVRAEHFLSKFIPVAKSVLIRGIKNINLKLPFPLVLKIISEGALHKTEIAGVRFVNSNSELEKNFLELLETAKRKRIKFGGVLAQEKLSGVECIIGIKRDVVFGHVILFGVGGVFSEVIGDTNIRKCPIKEEDAEEMINELKSRALFLDKGFRGRRINRSLLKKTLVKISKIPLSNKNISELDINPFILGEKIGKVADARIVFED